MSDDGPSKIRCTALKKDGEQCRNWAMTLFGEPYWCDAHRRAEAKKERKHKSLPLTQNGPRPLSEESSYYENIVRAFKCPYCDKLTEVSEM